MEIHPIQLKEINKLKAQTFLGLIKETDLKPQIIFIDFPYNIGYNYDNYNDKDIDYRQNVNEVLDISYEIYLLNN